MAIRVTRTNAEVIGTTSPNVLVTRTNAEVAGTTSPNIQVTRTNSEIAGTVSQPDARIFRIALMLLVQELAVTEHVVTASNTITFSQSVALESVLNLTANNSVSFSQSNSVAGVSNLTASNAISFSQSNVAAGPSNVTASNAITFSQVGLSSQITRTAWNSISLSQSNSVIIPGERNLTASNTITFTDVADSSQITRTAWNSISFSQSTANIIPLNTIVVTASNSITFSDSADRVFISVNAIPLSASDTITFTDRAVFPIELTASNQLTFTQTSDGNAGKSSTQTLVLTQTVILNQVRSITASNTVNFVQTFTGAKFRGGLLVPLGDLGGCNITRQYAPFGSGATGIRPVAPALQRHTDVELYYPSTDKCNSTSGITLRTPNFGDRDRNQYNRINRESRGGSLRIHRDPKWPSQRSLVMDFSGVKDSEVDSIVAFLEDTLGKKIGFRDWAGRQWSGIITNPDSPIVRNGTNLNDVSLELEVDAETLSSQVCDSITFSQLASVELVPV